MSCRSDLRDAMEDEAFVDITLVGTDMGEVPANKFMLAVRSPVFKTMFFAGFQEQESDKVCLGYPSVILKILVKYCYSDEVDLDLILEAERLTDQEARALIQLRDAARYFALHSVAKHIENEIGESVFKNKEIGCVCAILSELTHRIDDEGPFWDMFFQLVIHEPEDCLLPSCPSEANQGAMACPPQLLGKLLDKVPEKYVVVQCLQKWVENVSIEEESNASLLEVSKQLDLKELSLFQLSITKPSPIFPMKRIYEALVHHGKNTETAKMKEFKCVIYVSGSGVKELNGFYRRAISMMDASVSYQREGRYGEVACHFRIKWLPEHHKWIISVVPEDGNSVPFTMYESNCSCEFEIPFSFWKCAEGPEPAPLVAMMKTPSPSSKETSPNQSDSLRQTFGAAPGSDFSAADISFSVGSSGGYRSGGRTFRPRQTER